MAEIKANIKSIPNLKQYLENNEPQEVSTFLNNFVNLYKRIDGLDEAIDKKLVKM